jgi:hypothetical protein
VLFHEKRTEQEIAEEGEKSAYVRVPPGSTHVVALVEQAEVWYEPSRLVNVADIDAVQFHIATNEEAPTPFDFCITKFSAMLVD